MSQILLFVIIPHYKNIITKLANDKTHLVNINENLNDALYYNEILQVQVNPSLHGQEPSAKREGFLTE